MYGEDWAMYGKVSKARVRVRVGMNDNDAALYGTV